MKKLFVSLMAIAALVSCSKEEEISYADSMSKTIQISILNETEGTRAVGGDTAKGTTTTATNEELKVLFADKDGKILFEDYLTTQKDATTTDDNHAGVGAAGQDPTYVKDESTGKYMWHNVPADVKQIAVVRYEAGDITITPGTTNLSALLDLAKDEAKNLARATEDIILYGVNTLYDTGATHRVGATFFHVWQADVEVAPKVARFEVHSIKCTDLGTLNADDDLDTYDIDELLLKSLTWTGAKAEHSAPGFSEQRLYGVNEVDKDGYDANTCPEGTARSNEYKPANGAWSWNVAPCTFTGMKLDMDAYAYNYALASKNLPLTVRGLKKTANAENADGNVFEAGKIYTIDLTFAQSDIKTQDGICVEVVVTVKPWVIEKRYPVYGTPGSAPAATPEA